MSDPSRELVLKIYKNDDMKSYLKEISVFKRLDDMMKRRQNDSNMEPLVGFPDMISHIEG
jgi:hypothetical protein